MRKSATVLVTLGIVAILGAAASAQATDLLAIAGSVQGQTRRVMADLWLRQISNDKNLDGDHTTYYVSVYRKIGPQGEEHLVVGPRPVGQWRAADNKFAGSTIADKLIQARFTGDVRYVIRITHGDGLVALPNNPAVEFALDAGNHIVAFVPEAMPCSGAPGGQPGISLTPASHTWLWLSVEEPGLWQPQTSTC